MPTLPGATRPEEGGSRQRSPLRLALSALADEKPVLYASADGTVDVTSLRCWNATDACCDIYSKPVDDVAYASAIIDDVESKYSVDRKRIYLLGHSNGGFMVHRLACDLSSRVAAVVSLAGMTWDDAGKCAPTDRVSVLQMHGNAV